MSEIGTTELATDHQDILKKQLDRWLEIEFSHIDTAGVCERLFSYAPASRQRV